MPILTITGELKSRRSIRLGGSVRVKRRKRSKPKDTIRRRGTKDGPIVRIGGNPLAVGCDAVYREYRTLRRTPEFKAWWLRQFAKQDARCYYCDESLKTRRVNVEHIRPMSKGGQNNRNNLVLACSDCNRNKGSTPLSMADYHRYYERQRRREEAGRKAWGLIQREADYQAELGAWYRNNF